MSNENIAPLHWTPPSHHATKSPGPRRMGLCERRNENVFATPNDDDTKKYNANDLIQTSPLQERTVDSPIRPMENPLVIIGTRDEAITLGRGGAATVKIGKRNRQISRVHVLIQYNASNGRFELTVRGLNGVKVDGSAYAQHETAPLEDGSQIDILEDRVMFYYPPEPLQFSRPSSRTLASLDNVKLEDLPHTTPSAAATQRQKPAIPVAPTSSKDTAAHVKKEEMPAQHVDTPKEDTLSKTQEPTIVPEPEQKEGDGGEERSAQEEVKETEGELFDENDQENIDYANVIIDALVFSRTSSMPISDICSRVMKSHPAYKHISRELWTERISAVLYDNDFFGEIVRKGKTADGSPKENLYYYIPERDPIEWRRMAYTQVGRSARKCTLQDKQYFWKIPPKLGRNRHAYIPPPAKGTSSVDASSLPVPSTTTTTSTVTTSKRPLIKTDDVSNKKTKTAPTLTEADAST